MPIIKLLMALGILPKPHISDCIVMRIDLVGLAALMDNVDPMTYLSSIKKFQLGLISDAALVGGRIYIYDINDYIIAAAERAKDHLPMDFVALNKTLESRVAALCRDLNVSENQIRIASGIACGKALFPEEKSRPPVMGIVPDHAASARLAAKALSVPLAIYDDSAARFPSHFHLAKRQAPVGENGIDLSVYVPVSR